MSSNINFNQPNTNLNTKNYVLLFTCWSRIIIIQVSLTSVTQVYTMPSDICCLYLGLLSVSCDRCQNLNESITLHRHRNL